ncbi:TIGR04222 domain-containing membrane protein [Plantactinospora sp. GCM10030261]|uniref:TIGR04222 domain-containing membrane protein n=1 Tax=Plantactinospora sp. GCM10030261 TaxID=3273420 RepID=UPI00361FF7E0
MVGTVLAAAGDTWGVPGPTFLAIYLTLAAAATVGAVVSRIRVSAPDPNSTVGDHSGQLHPQQTAYLNGGPRLAVYTTLGALRGTGSIDVRDKRLAVTGPLPTGATPLDRAVHNAAANGVRARDLQADTWVVGALTDVRRDLERRGLVVDPDRRKAVSRFRMLLILVFALGVVRLFAGLDNDRPVGYLALSLLGVLLAALLTGRVPDRTRTGRATLRRLRDQHRHLSPSQSPAYGTYGATGAALGIALFGAAALYAMDPVFAGEAEVLRSAGNGGGDSGGNWGSCSGGSCDGGGSSGGSSCGGGGGGGCGGGGCGG